MRSLTDILKLSLSVALLFLLPLCGGAFADMADDVAFLYSAGKETAEQSVGLTELAMQAIFFASQANGTVTTHGTIREVLPSGTFIHEQAPVDLLRVTFLDGQVVEFVTVELYGQDLSGPLNFLRSDHVFRFEVSWTGDLKPLALSIQSSQTAGQRQGYVQGSMIIGGQMEEVDMALVGQSFFANDLSGTEYYTHFTWQGTVTTPELEVTVDEARDFELIVVNTEVSGGQSVSRSRIQINSYALIGSDMLAFDDAIIQTVFKDGYPSDPGYWFGTVGKLLYNQTVIGNLQLYYLYPYLKIQLRFTDGTTTDLQS